jgi:glycosyltransferase involved in cell wall biosynthesis
MNLVFVSLQRIDTDRESTSTCLAKELSKNHKVLYVNSPIDRKALFLNTNDEYINAHIDNIKKKGESLKLFQENLWVLHPKRIIESINWIPNTTLFKKINWINNKRFAKDIKGALEELKFENYILINDKDIFRSFYLKELLQPEKYIYLDRDYTIGMDYWRRHGVILEPQLMQKADAVVCNSIDFTKRAKLYNPNSFYIGNGGYINHNTAEKSLIPKDLEIIPEPRIGYVGALTSLRLDLNLLIELAKKCPIWNFVLIGPEDESFQKSKLHTLPNVYFLGKKNTKEISGYLHYFDVCINPQIVNEITIGNFPMKIIEYLASGRPVVATKTNTMKEIFEEHTFLAENTKDYIQQIKRALLEDSTSVNQERISFAKSFSWENVATSLLNCINSV